MEIIENQRKKNTEKKREAQKPSNFKDSTQKLIKVGT